VAATTYCELYSLSRSDLEAVLEQWPEVAAEFKSIGEPGVCRWQLGSCRVGRRGTAGGRGAVEVVQEDRWEGSVVAAGCKRHE
jgi:hypothetical protein